MDKELAKGMLKDIEFGECKLELFVNLRSSNAMLTVSLS